MDFGWNEEQRLWRQSVRDFAQAEIAPRVSEIDSQERIPPEIVRGMARLGLLAPVCSEEYGGAGMDWTMAAIAAEELGHIYPVDSASLSSGSGHLVVRAAEMIAAGMPAKEIADELVRLREKVSASFILDTLEFMRAGGRCSAVTAFGANLLKLKPAINVDRFDGGKMGVGKKYRGAMGKVLTEYVRDQLAGRDDLMLDRIFITHTGSPDEDVELVRGEIKKYANFKEIIPTIASGTISSHAGPRTLGVLFMVQ